MEIGKKIVEGKTGLLRELYNTSIINNNRREWQESKNRRKKYLDKEQEMSDMKNRIISLEKLVEKLIKESNGQ